MHAAPNLLEAIATVLCVAAVTTVLCQLLKQPVVLGYIVAGLIVGPHVPIPLVADPTLIHTLSELGVILLMFSLGLEFRLTKLVRVGPTAGLTAVIQSGLLMWLGFLVGKAFGWTVRESLFTGALIAISSTTIIAKAFDEQRIKGRLRELVVGILIVEDLIAILLMAALTTIARGAGPSLSALGAATGKLALFLIVLISVGLVLVPRCVRAITKLGRPETTLVFSVGLCFAVALLAHRFGYSVALGAFIAGSLVAESGQEKIIEHLVEPVRDIFAAIFFISVGMLIDPALVIAHWQAVCVLVAVVIVGKVVGVTFGAFLTGNGVRTSLQAGMSLAQIGEFSFIIAGLGLSLGATRDFLYPVAVAVSAITTLTTPWMIRGSGSVADTVDRHLPRPFQTFASLYGTWVERLRATRAQPRAKGRVRRLVGLLVLDAALLIGVAIGASLFAEPLVALVKQNFTVGETSAESIVLIASLLLAAPFAFGVVRLSRSLGMTLATQALPESTEDKVDLAMAPRRSLIVALQLAIVLVVGAPIVALTEPFLPGLAGVALWFSLLALLGTSFWRSATNLQGHVRAGAQLVVEVLTQQTNRGTAAPSLADLAPMLPGLGEPAAVQLLANSPAVGKTLADLNLRSTTGATVLAIKRGDTSVLVPAASEILHAGDVLALTGTKEAVTAASELLAPFSGDPTQ